MYELESQRQTEQILSRLILASCATYLLICITAWYWQDWNLIGLTFTGTALQLIPYGLLRHGRLRAASIFFVLNVVATVTLVATFGQGIHDLAIMAYPITILFAGLSLNRTDFKVSVVLTLAAMGWLVFGEAYGAFTSQPYQKPIWVDYVVVTIIFCVAAFGVDVLTTHMKKNLERAHQEIIRREHLEEELRYQGTHDALTRIYNRAFFETELARLERSREFPISIVIADVDDLKIINDTRGHAVGDALLRHAAAALGTIFRSADVLARVGGDEFAVLLPNTDQVTAEQIVARMRASLVEHNALHPDLLVQLSIGVATAEKGNLSGTYTTADQHMYANKTIRKAALKPPSAA